MQENNQEKSARIAKNTLYLFIRMFVVACVGFYTSRVVLQTLGVEDFGIYNIVGSIVVFLSFFRNALTNATYRTFTYELGHHDVQQLNRVFVMSINVHVLLALLIFIVLELGGLWFIAHKINIPVERMEAATCVFHFSLLAFVVEIVKTPYNSCIIAHERMNFYAFTSIIECVLKLGVVYLLLWSSYDKLMLYAILLAGVSVVMAGWYVFYCRRVFQETRYTWYWDAGLLKELLAFSGWSLVVNAADVLVLQAGNIFLNLFGSVTANAAMGIANQVNGQLNQLLASFTNSFNPQLIKSYAQRDMGYFMNLLFSTSRLSYYLLFLVSVPIVLNIDFLLRLWLVTPPDLAGIFFQLIICYSLIDAFSCPLWNAVYATGNLKVHQLLISGVKFLNIPLQYYFLVEGYPIYSVLVVYAALNGVAAIVRIVYLGRLIQLPVAQFMKEVLGRLALVSGLSVVLPLYSLTWDLSPAAAFWVSSVLFAVPYMGLVYFVGLNGQERNLFQKLWKRKTSC